MDAIRNCYAGMTLRHFIPRHSGMRRLAQARNPYSPWRRFGAERNTGVMIPGSLASLTPRNDDVSNSHSAPNSSASTNVSRVRVTSGQSRLKSATSRLHVGAVHGAVKRGLVGELIGRLMQTGIGKAPEPPRLGDAERFRRVGQMLACCTTHQTPRAWRDRQRWRGRRKRLLAWAISRWTGRIVGWVRRNRNPPTDAYTTIRRVTLR